MFLEKIELSGFKTFAQKTVINVPRPHELSGEEKGVTAIVGPNGSGKSNISDCVRWVLGEQSLKLLRLKKAEDVVFSGSEKKARLGMASASIFLNNEDNSADLPYAEVVITRRLYRDGESEYLINGSQVRLLDILILLAKANFGQKSYSIIGQGMIDYIINISPMERKEFFDEATGVKQYQIKRDQSVSKLNKTNENLESSKNVIKELEPRLNSLTRQIKKLEKRKIIENELLEIQKKYYSKIYFELKNELDSNNLKFQSKEEKRIVLQNEVLNMQKSLEKFALESSRTEVFNELSAQYNNLNKEKNKYTKELIVLKGKKEIEYGKMGKESIAWLENKKEELEGKIKEAKLSISELLEKISQKQKLLDLKIQKQGEVIAEIEKLENNLKKIEFEAAKKISMSDEDVKNSLKEIYDLQSDFIEKISKVENAEQILEIKKDAERIFSSLKNFYSKLSEKTEEEKANELEKIKEEIKTIFLTKDNLVNEINDLKTTVQIESAHKSNFEKNMDSLSEELEKTESELKKSGMDPSEKNKILDILEKEKKALLEKINFFDKQILIVKEKINRFNQEQEKKKAEIFKIQEGLQEKQADLNFISNEVNDLKVLLARVETKKENLEKEIIEELKDLNIIIGSENASDIDSFQAMEEIRKLKNKLEIIGGIDPEVVLEYNEVSERYEFLNGQIMDLDKAKEDLSKVIEELDKIIKSQFASSFQKINKLFSYYFNKLFLGGKAKLEIVQKDIAEEDKSVLISEKGMAMQMSKEELEEKNEETEKSPLQKTGIEIIAFPPHKKVKNIASLSGGERTMTSIALICAIISNNPSPFVLLDEVDAALDEANSLRFANIVKELSRKSQFLVITHNRVIMETANVIYGVSMGEDGVSRLLSINFEKANRAKSQNPNNKSH